MSKDEQSFQEGSRMMSPGKTLKVAGVIPARYASTRFPGKPLASIAGRPLLQWVIEGCLSSSILDRLIVATDDERIAELATSLNVEVRMTSSDLPSGTDRVWAAVKSEDVDIVLNIQGDEPLVSSEIIDGLIKPFMEDESLEMTTLAASLTGEDLENPNVVKAIRNQRGQAIYFSRFPIPFSRQPFNATVSSPISYKHLGLYGYRYEFLKKFCQVEPCSLEKAESLEQLRALYLGAQIHMGVINKVLIGVDTPGDVKRVEPFLQ